MGPAPKPLVQAGTTSRPILGVYYPSWKIYRGDKPSDLRLDLVTHVYYAFVRIQPDGTLTSLDAKADHELRVDGATGCLAALAQLKRDRFPHLRILLSIGGGSGSAPFPGVAADAAKTRRFCETAQALVQRYDFDGVDVDWEHPADPAQGRAFVALLRALRTALPAPRYELEAALPCGAWCLQHIDLRALLLAPESSPQQQQQQQQPTPTLDRLKLMAYDFAGPWTNAGRSGHHAALHAAAGGGASVAAATRYLAQQRRVPLARVVLGLPAYGRAFTDASGPGQGKTGGGGEECTYEYRDLPRPGASEGVDADAVGAYCVGMNTQTGRTEWVTYDNPATVRRKAQFVRATGLAGLFVWTGSFDARSDERSLVVAAHHAWYD